MARAALTLLLVLMVGCGEDPPGPPGKLDVAQVTTSADRIAAACAPDADPETLASEATVTGDVDKIIDVYQRTDPGARFQLEGGGEPTTMRDVMRVLETVFREGPCSAANVDRITRAVKARESG